MALASIRSIEPSEPSVGAPPPVLPPPAKKESTSSGDVPPQDTYRFAIEEYRFQAQFNWSRTQYLLVFNAAVLAAACGLLMPAGVAAVIVFLLGAFASQFSVSVMKTQQNYYRTARDRLKKVEAILGIPEGLRFNTTPGLAGEAHKGRSVNEVIRLLLWSITVADVAGAALCIARWNDWI